MSGNNDENEQLLQMRRKRVRTIKALLLAGPCILSLIAIVISVILAVSNSSLRSELDRANATITELQEWQNIHEIETDNLVKSQDEAATIISELEDKVSMTDSTTEIMEETETQQIPEAVRPVVYLTFDDGPSENTSRILDILKEYDVKATFFVQGSENSNLIPMYSRILDEGHSLGMHSFTHEYSQIYASTEAFATDVDRISDFLFEKTGVRPLIYRFPGGSGNTVSHTDIKDLESVLNDRGIRYFDWNVYAQDAVNPALDADTIVSNVVDNMMTDCDSYVLMHDMGNKGSTVEALHTIIEILKERGYDFKKIDENTETIHNYANTNKQ